MTGSRYFATLPTMRTWVGVVICALGMSTVGASVATADDERVERLIDEGLNLRERREDRRALEKFKAALAIDGSGRSRAQVALAHQALGEWLDAHRELTSALKMPDRWIEQHRTALESALDVIQGRLGRVEVECSVDGAEVRLNGQKIGVTPLSEAGFAVAGTVVLDVEADGYWPVTRQVQVGPGSLARETIKLVAQETNTMPDAAAETTVPESSNIYAIVGWTFAGAAAVGVAVGTAGLLIRNDEIDAYNDPSCLAGGRSRDENCGDRLDAADSALAMGISGFVAGGAFAIGSLVFLLLDDDAPSAKETAGRSSGDRSFVCAPGPGDIGAACALRF